MAPVYNENLPSAVAIHVAGLVVPVLVVAATHDRLALYLEAGHFLVLATAAFALAAWTLVDRFDLDRVTFAIASVLVPGLAVVVLPLLVLALDAGGSDVVRYLFLDVEGLFAYVSAFGLAGVAAAGLSVAVERRLGAPDSSLPSVAPATVPLAVWALVLLVVVVLVGANHAAAGSATVASVEPGLAEGRYPALVATVDGGPCELRLTATAPDGTTVTRRLARADWDGRTRTVVVRADRDGLAPPDGLPEQAGTYRVELETLAGVTVDAATLAVEVESPTAIAEVTTGREANDFEDPAFDELERVTAGSVSVGVVVAQTGGEFPTRQWVSLGAGDERVTSSTVLVHPGERAGAIFPLSADEVETVRTRHGGVVTVELYRDREVVASREVTLPPEE